MKYWLAGLAVAFISLLGAAVWLQVTYEPAKSIPACPPVETAATASPVETTSLDRLVADAERASEFPRGVWKTDGENLYRSVLGILPASALSPDWIEVTWREVGPTRNLYVGCEAKQDFNFKQQGTSPAIGNNLKCQVFYNKGSQSFPLTPYPPFKDLYFTYEPQEGGFRAELHYTTHDGWADMLTAGEFREEW